MNAKLAPAVRALFASVFLASLLLILHHQLPLIEIFDRFIFMFASASSVQTEARDWNTVVIGIDEATFEQDFLEQSPLDRCELAEKLRVLYDAAPRLLAIDLDLSPSLAGVLARDARVLACETTLYALLEAPRATRTVLIEPFKVEHFAAMAAKQAWQARLTARGVAFGQARLPVQFGVVQQQYGDARTLAAVAYGLGPPAGAHGPAATPEAGAVHGGAAVHEGAAAHDGTAHGHGAPKPQLLNFRAFGEEVLNLQWQQWLQGRSRLALAGKTVFFGANFGTDDIFITPLDELYGVNIHAAAFVSKSHQITRASNGAGLLLDVLIGLGFGWLVHFFWHRYLLGRANEKWSAFAFGWLLAMAIVYAGLILLLGVCAAMLIVARNIWISPLPMALGMTIDAFVIGAIHALGHARAEAHEAHAALHGAPAVRATSARASRFGAPRGLRMLSWLDVMHRRLLQEPAAPVPLPTRVMMVIKTVCWLAVVGDTLVLLFQH